jgi:hypothetical protein
VVGLNNITLPMQGSFCVTNIAGDLIYRLTAADADRTNGRERPRDAARSNSSGTSRGVKAKRSKWYGADLRLVGGTTVRLDVTTTFRRDTPAGLGPTTAAGCGRLPVCAGAAAP